MKNQRFFLFSVILLGSMHLFGFGFMQWELSKPLFVSLTPLNLLVSTVLLLFFHQRWNKNFLIFCFLTAFGGYVAEVAGVHTELIFGKYAYGKTLGIKLLDVPVLIAVNWLLLTYSINSVVEEFANRQKILKIILSAFLMTLLDFFIEPFAIENDLWHWYDQPVPFQNYVGWFVFSALFSAFFQFFPFPKTNSLAKWVVISQVAFFLAHFVVRNGF